MSSIVQLTREALEIAWRRGRGEFRPEDGDHLAVIDAPMEKELRPIPTGDPELDVALEIDCPACSMGGAGQLGTRGNWCTGALVPGATWSMCLARKKMALALRDHRRRIRCALLLLQTSRQTAVQRAGDGIVEQLVREAMDALRGDFPSWWTETDHLEAERDAVEWAVHLAQIALERKHPLDGKGG